MRLAKQLQGSKVIKLILLMFFISVFTIIFTGETVVAADKRITDIFAEGKLGAAYDIYKQPLGSKNNKKVRSTKTDYGKLYRLRSYVQIDNRLSYKAYLNGKFQGYIDIRAFLYVQPVDNITALLLPSFISKTKNVYAEGTLAAAYDIYKYPVGTKKNQKIRGTRSDYGKVYRIRGIVNSATHTSYKVYLNGIYQGYIDHRALQKINLIDYTNKNINNSYGEFKNKSFGTESFKVEKEIVNDLGSYYQIRYNKRTVLVSTKDITFIYTPQMESSATGMRQIKNLNTFFYQIPVENAEAKGKSVKSYQNRYLNIATKAKVKGEIWYKVWLNEHDGQKWTNPTLGWIKESNSKPVNDTTKKYEIAFNVPEKSNQQGLTYNNGIYYVAFDLSREGYPNHSKIIAYNRNGVKVKETSPLPIGHGAELSFWKNKLYATNGGGQEGAKLYVIDFESDRVEDVINLSRYGTNALAVVKDDNTIILHTSVDSNKEHVFSYVDKNGNLKKQFKIANAWVPQGIAYYNNTIYFYTNNLITKINDNGQVIDQEFLSLKGESQGIEINKTNGKVIFGYNGNNRIYEQK
ncbi:GW dipeptide domain-containing protein [Listeria booriae]|uniref:GW dipeptide domain-containing protein n=1 Tax=Listeria booriae TaxID=1552123 RepID=UPI0016273E0B|nr:GW dipeptide domain-containing protein [Listeria booriae]MBC2164842.1 hypothetical protein [Listeria booriae]